MRHSEEIWVFQDLGQCGLLQWEGTRGGNPKGDPELKNHGSVSSFTRHIGGIKVPCTGKPCPLRPGPLSYYLPLNAVMRRKEPPDETFGNQKVGAKSVPAGAPRM